MTWCQCAYPLFVLLGSMRHDSRVFQFRGENARTVAQGEHTRPIAYSNTTAAEETCTNIFKGLSLKRNINRDQTRERERERERDESE